MKENSEDLQKHDNMLIIDGRSLKYKDVRNYPSCPVLHTDPVIDSNGLNISCRLSSLWYRPYTICFLKVYAFLKVILKRY